MEWIGYILAVAAAIWVYRDAKQRKSKAPWAWALGVLAVLIVFFPLYLLFRPKKKTVAEPVACAQCGETLDGSHPFCPKCGQILKP